MFLNKYKDYTYVFISWATKFRAFRLLKNPANDIHIYYPFIKNISKNSFFSLTMPSFYGIINLGFRGQTSGDKIRWIAEKIDPEYSIEKLEKNEIF